jgi:hypothetical protein
MSTLTFSPNATAAYEVVCAGLSPVERGLLMGTIARLAEQRNARTGVTEPVYLGQVYEAARALWPEGKSHTLVEG